MSLLNVSDVTVQYGRGRDLHSVINAIENVSLEIPSKGYTMGIVGESGSGKTTLGLTIMNLIESPGRIVNGRVLFDGKDVLAMSSNELRKYRGSEVSMIYQSAMNSLNPVKTISSHIIEFLKEHRAISNAEAKEKAIDLLSQVGIPSGRENSYPHQYSGGMRQRVVVALAIGLSPKLLIADEPTSALDVITQQQVLELMKDLVSKNKTSLIFITHEILLLRGLVENVLVMHKGEIVEIGALNDVLSDPLHPYSEMLLGSLLTLNSKREDLLDLSDAQSSRNMFVKQHGCRFADRCKYSFDRCTVENPKLREVRKGRFVACHKF